MLIKATCHSCGNSDPTMFKHYDGMLGYEAYVCKKCGSYFDHSEIYPADKWSLDLVGLKIGHIVYSDEKPEMVEAQPNRKVVWK